MFENEACPKTYNVNRHTMINYRILEYTLYEQNEHLECMKDTGQSLAGLVNGSFLVL
jgi:hypothetical protein